MRIHVAWPLLVVFLSLAVVWTARGVPESPPVADFAFVDLHRVLREWPKYNETMQRLRGVLETIEAELSTERQLISDMEQRLAILTPDDATRPDLINEINQRKGAFNRRAAEKKKDLMEQETKVYAQAKKEIDKAVSRIAKQQGLKGVFQSDPITDLGDRPSVVRSFSSTCLYVDPRVDLTPRVVEEMFTAPAPDQKLPE